VESPKLPYYVVIEDKATIRIRTRQKVMLGYPSPWDGERVIAMGWEKDRFVVETMCPQLVA
jgi:hypothetical protein